LVVFVGEPARFALRSDSVTEKRPICGEDAVQVPGMHRQGDGLAFRRPIDISRRFTTTSRRLTQRCQ
jgi:hypothetical protein